MRRFLLNCSRFAVLQIACVVGLLARGKFGGGAHRLEWDSQGLASGIYLVHLRAGAEKREGKIVLAR